jgi:hypothetical protein
LQSRDLVWHHQQNVEEIVRKALKNLVALDAGFACGTRHFYNNSNMSWDLHMDKSTCSLPNGPNVKDCTVPPGGVAELHYSNWVNGGDMFQFYGYGSFGFVVNPTNCHIEHPNQGNTGNVALNAPATGDVTTCGRGGWTCQ